MIRRYNRLIPVGHPNRPGTDSDVIDCQLVHYTGNDAPGATDTANAEYSRRKYRKIKGVFKESNGKTNFRYGSANKFIDKDSITLSIPVGEVTWNAGDRPLAYNNGCKGQTKVARDILGYRQNYRSISYEMCNNSNWDIVVSNTIEEMAQDAVEYNIRVGRQWTHNEVSGKRCPAMFVDHPEQWEDFKRRFVKRVGEIVIEKSKLPIKLGTTGPIVEEVRELLINAGCKFSTNDKFGKLEHMMVGYIQDINGLPVTGEIDERLLMILQSKAEVPLMPANDKTGLGMVSNLRQGQKVNVRQSAPRGKVLHRWPAELKFNIVRGPFKTSKEDFYEIEHSGEILFLCADYVEIITSWDNPPNKELIIWSCRPTSNLSLRETAVDGKRREVMDKGSLFYVYEEKNGWLRGLHEESAKEGWCSKKYTAYNDEENSDERMVKRFRMHDSDVTVYIAPKGAKVMPSVGKLGRYEKLSDVIKSDEDYLAVCNCGFFGGGKEHLGTLIIDGGYYYPPNSTFIDLIKYPDRHEVRLLGSEKSLNIEKLQADTKGGYVVGTSWSLMIGGKIDIRNARKIDHSASRQPRMIYGYMTDGRFFICAIDGRNTKSVVMEGSRSKGTTDKQSADIVNFIDDDGVGVDVALNGDGGGSAELIVLDADGKRRIKNKLSGGSERRIGTFFTIKK